LGLEANIAGALCYSVGFLSGIFFLVIERRSRFVRFHAMQSTLIFAALFASQWVLGHFAFFGVLTSGIVLISLCLWAFMILKAFDGETFRLPVVGDRAARELEKPL
jgi:uncharacterized membrane protein